MSQTNLDRNELTPPASLGGARLIDLTLGVFPISGRTVRTSLIELAPPGVPYLVEGESSSA